MPLFFFILLSLGSQVSWQQPSGVHEAKALPGYYSDVFAGTPDDAPEIHCKCCSSIAADDTIFILLVFLLYAIS